MSGARAALLLFVLAAASTADAHPAPFSYLDLYLGADRMRGSLILHVIDVAHDLEIEPADRLLHPNGADAVRASLIRLLASRLEIRADGEVTALRFEDIEPLTDRQSVRLSFEATRAPRATLEVRARLFPYDRYHQTFVNIYESASLRQQIVLSDHDSSRMYYTGTTQGSLAVVGTFGPAGVHHILIGPDHILFLVGLLLLGGGWWPLLRIVTAFTVGHSATLSLAALGIVTPPASVIEPAIALSIVFVGADNLLVGTSGRDVRPWIALGFGLVHGFGFASVLREFGLPREALGWSLFSFNLGVEIGQILVVTGVAVVLAGVSRWNRPFERRLAYAGSIVVIVAGAYWFIERVFFGGGVS